MRMTATLTIVLGMAHFAMAQLDQPPPPRYQVESNLPAFPQSAPKEALTSAIRAMEGNRFDYLAAHLLEPGFVDAQVTQRVPLVEATAEKELRFRRDAQRQNPQDVTPRNRLPDEPSAFAKVVAEHARVLAFRVLVRDIQDTLADNPSHLKDLRRFARVAEIPANGNAAAVTLPTLPGRGVYFQLVEKRWYLLDGQQPPVAPAPPAPAPGN
ncbi:MAG: hypothetical protein LC104_21045 [Bacteroidales bacterium]|nr:hypothetical protein [Bacteroidales bacterium]